MWVLLLVSTVLAYQVRVQHFDDRLYFWLNTTWQQAQPADARSHLPNYRVQVDARPVPQVADNLSGLTFDEHRNQLWAVLNNPEELLAMSKDGEVLARYPLNGFTDVEGVTYLGDDLLLLAEERSQALVVMPVPRHPGPLLRGDYPALTLGLDAGGNQGFEGVGYDREGDRLFVVKEHSPRALYEVRGLKASIGGAFNLQVIDRSAWLGAVFATDLSSVHYDENSGQLLLLSDESQMMVALDGEGRMLDYRTLSSGFAGLQEDVPQGEGMTLDDSGNLYLVSEPNLFYRFERVP